jgi:putative nucleotidyltransferase with HDIG domain
LKEFKLTQEERYLIGKLEEAVEIHGQESYIVGGYVRDKLLGRPMNNDIDVVCVGDGIALAKTFASLFQPRAHYAYYKNFGTAMVKWEEWEIEFVGARKESYREDSRKPIVYAGSLEDDQKRRDFTINALAISLNKTDRWKLLDPFNGRADLESGILRTPLDPVVTFSDDPLRMMRAIRFANQLDFELLPEVRLAILENAHRIQIVSSERIMGELQKIMACKKPSVGLLLMENLGLMNHILPEFSGMKGIEEKNGVAHKDNFYHTLQVLDNVAEMTQNIWLRWAALLHDIAKPATKKFDDKEGWTFHGHEIVGASMVFDIFKRLKLPLDHKMKYVQKLVKLHLRPMALASEEVTDSALRRLLFDAGEDIDDLITLCRADITSKNERKIKRFLANYDAVIEKLREVEERDRIRNWQPPIDGQLIMDTFQIPPSKIVGEIKTAIREAILEGDIHNDFDEAYAFMVKVGKEMGLDLKD